jgi:hypothetical protein
VVRDSLLEQAHHDGPLGSGIIPTAQHAAGPLSHLLAAHRRHPVDAQGPNPFAGLAERPHCSAGGDGHPLTEGPGWPSRSR